MAKREPSALRRDYETIARAIRELSNAWVREQVPSQEVGLELVTAANVALAHLAVAADVPHN